MRGVHRRQNGNCCGDLHCPVTLSNSNRNVRNEASRPGAHLLPAPPELRQLPRLEATAMSTGAGRSRAWRSRPRAAANRLHRLRVAYSGDGRVERAIVLLRFIFNLDLLEIEGELSIGDPVSALSSDRTG
jgi:hypothetical protein